MLLQDPAHRGQSGGLTKEYQVSHVHYISLRKLRVLYGITYRTRLKAVSIVVFCDNQYIKN